MEVKALVDSEERVEEKDTVIIHTHIRHNQELKEEATVKDQPGDASNAEGPIGRQIAHS